PLGKDEYEIVDPVDILTPLKKSGFWNKVVIARALHSMEVEINQLQKLSLSDPREQNKMDVDGEDGYNQFLKSFPPWWDGVNRFEHISSEDLMPAEWCTTCGLLDDSCRCKRYARLPNMEELPPSLLSPSLLEVEYSRVLNYGELVVIEEGKRVEGPMTRDLRRLRSSLIGFCGGEEDEKELVEMGEVGGGPFGGGEGGEGGRIAMAGVDRDKGAEKGEVGRIS
ncbi:hypothetical protein Tco_0451715, partial [Tanacetum coccineum]